MNLSVGTMNEFFSLRDVDKAENFLCNRNCFFLYRTSLPLV